MPAEVDDATVNMEKSVASKSGDETKESETPKKKKRHRKRKRHNFNSIREQMEFYFGDANLSKDRFLNNLITKDPYVSLDVFLTFNKMKSLVNSVEEIANSLSNSQLIELDESQQKVRRKTPLPAERNVDDKTLYVESIPSTADHDWMKQVFSAFGTVAYVSLPKYTNSREIKGFGFIEFEEVESVAKAVKAFQELNGVLSMQETDPADLESIKAYNNDQRRGADKLENNDTAEELPKSATNKRKHNGNSDSQLAKKKREDSSTGQTATDGNFGQDTSTSAFTEVSLKQCTEVEEPDNELSENRQKQAKKKSKKSKDVQMSEAYLFDLKVLPKRDWKRLRNKYLNLQREKISELKRAAWKAKQLNRKNLTDGNEASSGLPPANAPKPRDHKISKIDMNFDGAEDADKNECTAASRTKETKNNPALERQPLFSYEPGLIIEVSFAEMCVAVKKFKADMRQYSAVKYVDVKEGEMKAHLRVDSASAAEEFIKQISCDEYKCKILTGEEEKQYWRKIEHDREMKLNKLVKVPQRRGREKIKKLLAKHIRYGDEDEGESKTT